MRDSCIASALSEILRTLAEFMQGMHCDDCPINESCSDGCIEALISAMDTSEDSEEPESEVE